MNVNQVFPLTTKVVRRDIRSLVAVIILYLVVCAAVKVADFLLGWVPLIGMLLGIVFWVIGLYCAIGIIVAVLEYVRTEQ